MLVGNRPHSTHFFQEISDISTQISPCCDLMLYVFCLPVKVELVNILTILAELGTVTLMFPDKT